ncbi:tyrosine-type recombinase/integrase [Halothiobacillus sp.]|uniref:tyrosine-type recombinase/integrase n=1 Tax=Halothiobacillus sp. TaxID=1891311 RepID=UPI002603C5EF|nr:tyrosine-type recombinase/integrase [Halothiobacillus sp.]
MAFSDINDPLVVFSTTIVAQKATSNQLPVGLVVQPAVLAVLIIRDAQCIYIFKNRCIKAGIEGIWPHDMLRSFATRLLESVDPLTVQAIAGHSLMQTTARYDRRG